MNLVGIYTVLEDGEIVATFDSYFLAVEHIDKHAVHGRKYQVVKVYDTEKEPRQTVADTGWKGEYIGMWADVDGFGRPQLIFGTSSFKDIAVSDFPKPRTLWVGPAKVCPRYDLALVNLTPHPAYLETLEDYESAPVNTVVASAWDESCPDFAKDTDGRWAEFGGDESDNSSGLADIRRKVIYWPEEEE